MMRRGTYLKPRISWKDRFQAPGLEDLLAPLTRPHLQLVEHARQSLLALGGVSETISWLGIPWRWTLAYGLDSASERPWAYVVPQPGRPLLALPMSGETVKSLPIRRLPKFIRDVIILSPKVAGVHWMQWELTGRTQLDELISLARRKHEAVLSPSLQ